MNSLLFRSRIVPAIFTLILFSFYFFLTKPQRALDRKEITRLAREQLGRPYLFGGDNVSGFDCSGLTMYVYGESGIPLPRTTRAQFNATRAVENPGPGDLLFFNPEGTGINHVGIYIGNGEFIHAPSSGKVVRISRLSTTYWRSSFVGARSWQPTAE